jgi:hypothetical protein
MFLPPLQGVVLTRLGNQASVVLIAVYASAMLLVNFIRERTGRQQSFQSSATTGTIPVK